MTHRYACLFLLISLASLATMPSKLEAQEREPYSLDQIVELVESGVFSDTRILMLVRGSCLGFRFDDEAALRLRRAGATEGLIADLEDVCTELPRVVDTVVVTPAELDVPVGASRILRAQALAPDSTPITGVVFEWTSQDTAVAEVSGGGMVLAKAPGEVRVTATTREGPVGSALVRVASSLVTPTGEEAALEREAAAAGGKSVGTAAALGVAVPGGGEFYTGNTGKGVAILAGSAAALAAGYFITTEEVLSVSYDATAPGSCDPSEGTPCTYSVTRFEEVKETNNLVYGAAAAGALWLYGLVDGIRAAKNSQTLPAEEQDPRSPGISLEILPADGVRYTALGEVELTFIRIRS
ncbi:MAG: Ig-like domain-containing protein [Gemmatimonadota bacterium]|nr:MAG: Ig-like domain-containing protein [Gemmatimonadota bacterium]